MRHEAIELFSNYVAINGMNMSRQRIQILEFFLSSGNQLSADDLYIKIRTQNPAIGRTTVYRTLKLIAESGIALTKLQNGKPTQYENRF
jgi:Fur family transcriptional regulator, ferric uptake regulator